MKTFSEFINQSPEFRDKYNTILLNTVKKIITPNSVKNYLKDNDIEPTYENLEELQLIDLCDYFSYDIGEELNNKLKIPQDIYLSSTFIDDLLDSLDTEIVERYLYQVWNRTIMPLVKKKLEYIINCNDKIGDDHTIDITEFDVHTHIYW